MNHTNTRPRGRPPKPVQGRDAIYGNAIYPIGTILRKLGIARNTLTSMRRRGLKIHFLTRKCGVIDGRELIEFLRAEWQKESDSIGVDQVQHEESEQRP